MRLTPSRFSIFSAIARDVAQVFFASVFIGPLLSGEANMLLVSAGLLLALFFWFLSMLSIHE